MKKTKQQVRDELMELKYYHTYRDVFDARKDEVKSAKLENLSTYYNRLMLDAPMKLLHIYFEYYLTEQSQEQVADRCYVSVSCISKLCQHLVAYLSEHSDDYE